MQQGVFVENDCKPFAFSGYNAWQVRSLRCALLLSSCMHALPIMLLPVLSEASSLCSLCSHLMCCQTIEAALGMCCGGPTALTAQFKEAGEFLPVRSWAECAAVLGACACKACLESHAVKSSSKHAAGMHACMRGSHVQLLTCHVSLCAAAAQRART